MIKKQVTLTVQNGKQSRLSEPIVIYQGDKDIMLEIQVQQIGFQFSQFPRYYPIGDEFYQAELLVEYESGKKAKLPKYGRPTQNNIIQFSLDGGAFDDDDEATGEAKFQIVLYDFHGACITLPEFPVTINPRIVNVKKDEFTYLTSRFSVNSGETILNHGSVSGTFSFTDEYKTHRVHFTDNTVVTLPTVTSKSKEMKLIFTVGKTNLKPTFNGVAIDRGKIFYANTGYEYELILVPSEDGWKGGFREIVTINA